MARFTLHAVAADRPGIVAAVTQALAAIGCNLQDSRMTLLHGQFSLVVVLEAPGQSNGMAIEEALSPLLEEFALQLLISPIPDDREVSEAGQLVRITVDGADHPGTVSRVAQVVTDSGGNIVELVGHVILKGSATPSHLQLDVTIDEGSLDALRTGLDGLCAELEMSNQVTLIGPTPS